MPTDWTSQDEAQYQALRAQFGITDPAPTPPAPQGLLGFAGQTAANVLPGALEKIVQPAQTLMGIDPQLHGQIPRFFDTQPQGLAQKVVGGIGQLAEYIPAMALTEGMGAEGLAGLGASRTAARVGGAALGWGLPMAPEGGETAATQGAVGALQSAAQDFGWRGKLAAGIAGAGIGYYEGQQTDPQTGALYAGINLAGPTIIDPILHHLFGGVPAKAGANPEPGVAPLQTPPPNAIPSPTGSAGGSGGLIDIGGGRPIAGQAAAPNGASGNINNHDIAPQGSIMRQGAGGGAPPPQPTPQLYGGDIADLQTQVLSRAYPETGVTHTPVTAAANPAPPPPQANLTSAFNAPGEGGLSLRPTPSNGGLSDIGAPQQTIYPQQPPVRRPGFANPDEPILRPALPVGPETQSTGTLRSEQVASLQPIAGPALFDRTNGQLLSDGPIGTQHKDLMAEAINKMAEGDNFDPGNIEHGFTDANGNILSRSAAADRMLARGDITPQQHAAVMARSEPGMTSQDLIAIEAKKGKVAPAVPDAVQDIKAEAAPPPTAPRPTEPAEPAAAKPQAVEKPVTVVIRHGATELNAEGGSGVDRIRGWQDHPLNEQGRQDAIEAAAPVKQRGVTHLISSDLSRAKETADIIGKEIGATVETNPGLRPWGLGPTIEGHPTLEVMPKIEALARSPDTVPEGGESFNQFKDRFLGAYFKAEAQHPNENIGLVTHYRGTRLMEGWRAAGKSGNNIDLDTFLDRGGPPGSVDVLDRAGDVIDRPALASLQTAKPDQVRIQGRYGLETANIMSREGDVLHVEVDDPIFGKRQASVRAQDTLPIDANSPSIPSEARTRPFADVESAKLRGTEAQDMLGTTHELQIDKEAVRRQNVEPSGKVWLNGKLVFPTTEEVERVISTTDSALAKVEQTKTKLEQLKSENPTASLNEIRRHLRADTRESSWDEAIKNLNKQIKDAYQWREDLRNAAKSYEEYASMRGSVMEGAGPAKVGKSLPGRRRTDILTISEGLAALPREAAAVVGRIMQQLQEATGHAIDTHFSTYMPGAKGGAYESSGRVGLNLQWVHQVLKGWDTFSGDQQARAVMRMTALYGHEISHVAQLFGEKSNLQYNGEPLLAALQKRVEELSLPQRTYIQEQIKRAKGELGGGVSAYLSGDADAVFKYYSAKRSGLTMDKARELAAGEFMAEMGATELAGRMKLQGLPNSIRDMLTSFKQVVTNVVNWFRGKAPDSSVAALQDLQTMSAKMFDHFAASDQTSIQKAFPMHAEGAFGEAPRSPFEPSAEFPAKGQGIIKTAAPLPSWTPPPITTPPAVQVQKPFMATELARLGVRAAVGATAGGLLAPHIGDGQVSTAEGVILGGIMGMFGPAVAKRLLEKDFAAEVGAAFKDSGGNPIKALAQIMGGGKTLDELGREARFGWTGQSSALAKFVRFTEQELKVNLDPAMQALVQNAKGMGADVVATLQDALDKSRWFKPNDSMNVATDAYLTGRMSKDEYRALMTGDEANNYANFVVTAREAMTTLLRMYASGLPDSTFKNAVMANGENYLGRFYSAYKEGKFNMEYFEAAKQDLMARFPDYTGQMADEILREHMREVQANQSLFGRRGNSGQKLDTSLSLRRLATEQEIEAQQSVVAGLEHDPGSTAYQTEKAKLDWMQTHQITDAWRGWLGEIKDPVQRAVYTFQKLHPSAISSAVFDMLDNRVNSDGLKFAYDTAGLQQVRELLAHGKTKLAPNTSEFATMQNKLDKLDGYGQLPMGAAYGKLQGKWVDRFTRDELNTYSTPFKFMEQPILRGIASFNNAIKLARGPYNPLTVIRNVYQLPLFMAIAKVAPGDIGDAWNIINKTRGEDYHLMFQRGILGADIANPAELSRGPGVIASGFHDADVFTKVAHYANDKILGFYQQPDMLVRAGAFLSARRRFAQEALENGVQEIGEDGSLATRKFASLQDAMAHESTISRAVNFTERYTMNYDTVPRITKFLRQIPFVSLFLSYTSEITKILKNLTSDAISPSVDSAGRMHAITVLAGMAAVPAMLTAYFEGQLSDKDRSDWAKVRALQPDYNRSRFQLPISRDSEGRFHYFDITNLLPADSYSQMINAFSKGDMKSALEANPVASLQNTPLLNMVATQISGTDTETGLTVKDFGRAQAVLKEILPPIIPPGYEGQRLTRTFTENEQGELGTTNLRTGVQTRPGDIIANYLTAMKFGNVQLSTVERQAMGEAQQDIAVQQQIMRDTINQNVAADKKQDAINRYSENVRQIMLKFQSKLQTTI